MRTASRKMGRRRTDAGSIPELTKMSFHHPQ
jgi:hypothetical protein